MRCAPIETPVRDDEKKPRAHQTHGKQEQHGQGHPARVQAPETGAVGSRADADEGAEVEQEGVGIELNPVHSKIIRRTIYPRQ